jgi:hypothetical protein
MRSNPNIIANAMLPPQVDLPDINAMMQTRTAGMENIYKIEQQRAEQQRVAQQEQEAAAIEAMLPSVVAAYSDPSDAGLDQAISLMPDEVRDTFAPFVSRLKTVRDPAARKAIIEAELAKDEAGRAVLDRVPTEIQRLNADIQRGQLDVSRQRLAMEAAEAGRPAAGDYATVETAQGIFILNKKTGELVPATAAGGMPGPRAVPEPTSAAPISTEQPPQVLQPKPKAATEITQTERRAASLLDNVVRNANAVNEAITETPDAFQPTAAEAAVGFLPWGQQQVKAWEQNPQRKIVYNRMRQSIDALLTLATGAAYTQAQLDAQIGAYMPGFFDEDVVKADKIRALRDRIESEKLNAGRAWTSEQEARANDVFAQFENIVSAMSTGTGGAGGGEVDTSNPLLQD